MHRTNIDSAAVNFRTIYSQERQALYYPRYDYSSPARFVNEHTNPDDVVLSMVYVVPYYLQRVDYMYINFEDPTFTAISACGGMREIWTNVPLIYRQAALLNLIENSGRPVWIIMHIDHTYRTVERNLKTKYGYNLVFTNIDGSIEVLRIPPDSS